MMRVVGRFNNQDRREPSDQGVDDLTTITQGRCAMDNVWENGGIAGGRFPHTSYWVQQYSYRVGVIE